MDSELEKAQKLIAYLNASLDDANRKIRALMEDNQRVAKEAIVWRDRVVRYAHTRNQAELMSYTVDIGQFYSLDRPQREELLRQSLIIAMSDILRQATPENMLMRLLRDK